MLLWHKPADSFCYVHGSTVAFCKPVGVSPDKWQPHVPCANTADVAAHKLDQRTDQLIRYALRVWPEGDDAVWLGWGCGWGEGAFQLRFALNVG